MLDSLLHYDEQAELYIAQLYDKYQLQLQHSLDSNCDSDEIDSNCSETAWNWSDYDMDLSNNNNNEDDALSSTSGAGSHSTSNSNPSPSLVPSSLKRRGHQHHPRFSGTRRPNVPNVQEILAALYRGDSKGVLSNLRGEVPAEPADLEADSGSATVSRSTLSLPLTDSVTNSVGSNSPTPTDESSAAAPALEQPEAVPAAKKKKKKRDKDDQKDKSERKKKSTRSKRPGAASGSGVMELSSDSLATDLSAGAVDEGIVLNPEDEDNQAAEWAKLRCTSEAAEIVAEREARRNKGRCADYPGLAFGRSIFSSDTMMKFNIIRNELHNIMNTQLKRVIRRHGTVQLRYNELEQISIIFKSFFQICLPLKFIVSGFHCTYTKRTCDSTNNSPSILFKPTLLLPSSKNKRFSQKVWLGLVSIANSSILFYIFAPQFRTHICTHT